MGEPAQNDLFLSKFLRQLCKRQRCYNFYKQILQKFPIIVKGEIIKNKEDPSK